MKSEKQGEICFLLPSRASVFSVASEAATGSFGKLMDACRPQGC